MNKKPLQCLFIYYLLFIVKWVIQLMENMIQYHVVSCFFCHLEWCHLRVMIILFIAGKLVSQGEDCKFSKGRSNSSC